RMTTRVSFFLSALASFCMRGGRSESFREKRNGKLSRLQPVPRQAARNRVATRARRQGLFIASPPCMATVLFTFGVRAATAGALGTLRAFGKHVGARLQRARFEAR